MQFVIFVFATCVCNEADGTPFEPDVLLTMYFIMNPVIQWAEALNLPVFVNTMFPALPSETFPTELKLIQTGKISRDWLFDEGLINNVFHYTGTTAQCREHVGLPPMNDIDKQTFSGARKARLRLPTIAAWYTNITKIT